jgi:DNA-binding response OmpR family regulator
MWAPNGAIPILLIGEDRESIELLGFSLKRAGLEPIAAHDAAVALSCFEQRHPDLVVLDMNLGASSGLALLMELRRLGAAPVIMLTALHSEDDKVRGLDAGADDYVTKPFSHRELIARIRAQLRRSGREGTARRLPEPRLQVGSVILDPADHSVTKAGQMVSLTLTEFRLLSCLMANAGTVVPTHELLEQVWGYQDPGGSEILRVTLHRLRRKLENEPSRPRLIHTISGLGILLKADAEPV